MKVGPYKLSAVLTKAITLEFFEKDSMVNAAEGPATITEQDQAVLYVMKCLDYI